MALGGKLGDVGDANGDLELVLGGGGGGTLRLTNCDNNSTFLSGTGGFGPVAGFCMSLNCVGGELSSLLLG